MKKKEKSLCFSVFSSLQKCPLYNGLVEEENSNNGKQGINLAVTPKIREVGKTPFGVPLLQQEGGHVGS